MRKIERHLRVRRRQRRWRLTAAPNQHIKCNFAGNSLELVERDGVDRLRFGLRQIARRLLLADLFQHAQGEQSLTPTGDALGVGAGAPGDLAHSVPALLRERGGQPPDRQPGTDELRRVHPLAAGGRWSVQATLDDDQRNIWPPDGRVQFWRFEEDDRVHSVTSQAAVGEQDVEIALGTPGRGEAWGEAPPHPTPAISSLLAPISRSRPPPNNRASALPQAQAGPPRTWSALTSAAPL